MLEQKDWLYERGEGRYKHRWRHDKAGFEEECGVKVGKCHSSIDIATATELLRNGIVYNAPGTTTPEHVYAVYRGVIYEAAPTSPGKSFHGYPWMGSQGRPALPPRVVNALRVQATAQGELTEFEKWLKQYK